jgi:hypothetical protein
LNTILEKFVLPGVQVDIVGAVNDYKLGPYRYKVAGVATPILPLNGDILQSLITVAVPPGFSLAAVALAQLVPVGNTSYSQTNPWSGVTVVAPQATNLVLSVEKSRPKIVDPSPWAKVLFKSNGS